MNHDHLHSLVDELAEKIGPEATQAYLEAFRRIFHKGVTGLPVVCTKCHYAWRYRGKSWYARCPNCMYGGKDNFAKDIVMTEMMDFLSDEQRDKYL